MTGRLHPCVAGLLAALVAACSTSSTTEQVTNAAELKPLAFLSAGPVSRKDIEGRLGAPWSAYEDGRIVIYHFDAVTEPLRRAEWRGGPVYGEFRCHCLVIQFGDDGLVDRRVVLSDSGGAQDMTRYPCPGERMKEAIQEWLAHSPARP